MEANVAGALPIIVTNYARAFGVRVRMQGSEAYTNGREIVIPRLDINDKLKARLAYGYLAHEASHVRYTDFRVVQSVKENFLRKSLLNILEDARVEQLIGSSFIGVWENLELLRSYPDNGWNEFERDALQKPALQLFLAYILCYTGCYAQRFKILRHRAAFLFFALRRRVNHECLRRISRLSLKILSDRNTAEVLNTADAIVEVLNTGGCFCVDAGKLKKSRRKSTQKSYRLRMGNELKAQCQALERSTEGLFSALVPGCEAASIVSALGNTQQSARDDLGVFDVGVCRPGRRNFLILADTSSNLRRRLKQKISSWLDVRGGGRIAGRRINPYRAAFLKTGESRIFYDRLTEQGLSVSVHLLVDVSGSMLASDGEDLSRCEAACRCALSLAMALDGIDGIVPLCSFFPGSEAEVESALSSGQKVATRSAFFDQKPRGSTPLAQALWHAEESALMTSCKRHIVLVLTDGIPDSVMQAKIAAEHLASQNIECYGIGIRLDFIKSLLPCSTVIRKPSELDEAIFKLLSKVIVPQDL